MPKEPGGGLDCWICRYEWECDWGAEEDGCKRGVLQPPGRLSGWESLVETDWLSTGILGTWSFAAGFSCNLRAVMIDRCWLMKKCILSQSPIEKKKRILSP